MTDDVLLTILIVLPFVGSLLAATFRPNARNSEAWLAGGVALVCLFLLISAYPAIVERGVLRSEDWRFPGVNLLGSLAVMLSLVWHPNDPSLVIELFWAGISLYGVWRNLRGRRVGAKVAAGPPPTS